MLSNKHNLTFAFFAQTIYGIAVLYTLRLRGHGARSQGLGHADRP
jgi:hypothetical protein